MAVKHLGNNGLYKGYFVVYFPVAFSSSLPFAKGELERDFEIRTK